MLKSKHELRITPMMAERILRRSFQSGLVTVALDKKRLKRLRKKHPGKFRHPKAFPKCCFEKESCNAYRA